MRRARPITFLLSTLLLSFACAPGDNGTPAEGDADLVARARDIHERTLTLDTHDDIEDDFAGAVDPLNADRQVTLEKMRAGGLDVAFFVVYVGQGERTPDGYAQARAGAMTKFAAIHRMADEMYPDQIEIAYHPEDVERIVGSGQARHGDRHGERLHHRQGPLPAEDVLRSRRPLPDAGPPGAQRHLRLGQPQRAPGRRGGGMGRA